GRDPAGRAAPTDAAGRDLLGHAGSTDRSVRAAGSDALCSSAADAVFPVDRVVDQTERAERTALVVAGGRFANVIAARAGHGTGSSEAGPADPQPVTHFAQRDDPPAAG